MQMNASEIQRMTEEGEGVYIEFKSSFPAKAIEIAQDMAAFANTGGGTILIGIDDKGNVVGVHGADETMQRLVGVARKICKPALQLGMGRTRVAGGKEVVWAKIEKRCDSLCMVSGKCYIRSGPTAIPVEDSSELERLLPAKKRPSIAIPVLITLVFLVGAGSVFWLYVHTKNLPVVHLEAKKLFELAQKYELQGDDELALSTLDQAISLNPRFAEAALEAALIANQLDEDDRAEGYLRRAEQSPDTLSESSKLKVRALRNRVDGDWDKALGEYQALAEGYPKDPSAQFYWADLAIEMGRDDDATKALQRCLKLAPLSPYCNFDQMIFDVERNEFDQVLKLSESLKKKEITYPWFDAPVGLALWGKDELEQAQAHLQKLAETRKKLHGTTHLKTAMEWVAGIELYKGGVTKSKKQIQELLSSGKPYARANYFLDLAEIDVLLGNHKAATVEAKSAIEQTPNPLVRIAAARLFAASGNASELARVLHGKGPGSEPIVLGEATKHFIDGSLALSRRNYQTAVEELELSYKFEADHRTQFFLARAQMASHDWDGASVHLAHLIDAKGAILVNDSPLLWPLAHYYLGLCYDESGNRKLALNYYRKFMGLWHRADADLSVLVSARKRASALGSP